MTDVYHGSELQVYKRRHRLTDTLLCMDITKGSELHVWNDAESGTQIVYSPWRVLNQPRFGLAAGVLYHCNTAPQM